MSHPCLAPPTTVAAFPVQPPTVSVHVVDLLAVTAQARLDIKPSRTIQDDPFPPSLTPPANIMPLLSRKPKEVSEDLPENPLAQLVNYDVLVLMDDSGSMEGSLWSQVRDR
jgi:hypothetical protein